MKRIAIGLKKDAFCDCMVLSDRQRRSICRKVYYASSGVSGLSIQKADNPKRNRVID